MSKWTQWNCHFEIGELNSDVHAWLLTDDCPLERTGFIAIFASLRQTRDQNLKA